MRRTILTMNEVSEMTRVPLDTLRYWRGRGDGPASFRIGRRVRYDLDAVTDWLDSQMSATQANPLDAA